LEPEAALIYASSGSILIFESAPAPAPDPEENKKWLRLNHAAPGAPTPAPQPWFE